LIKSNDVVDFRLPDRYMMLPPTVTTVSLK